MPNWCMNRVTITTDTQKEMAEILEATTVLVEGYRQISFDKLVPMPPILKRTKSGLREIDGEKVKVWFDDGTLEEPKPRKATPEEQAELEQTGCESWYDWALANWGTKWDAAGGRQEFTEHDEDCVEFEFETAWAPPEAWLNVLRERFPNASISAFYDEPGMQVAGYL